MTLKEKYKQDGYVIISNDDVKKKVEHLRSLFVDTFESKFNDDPSQNRNLIKRFSDTLDISRLFSDPVVEKIVKEIGVESPVFCGPVVTHYTSNNKTGNSYGLPFHQDWPSMAGSDNSGILWISLNDCSIDTHSLEIIPQSHIIGLHKGTQVENGYVMENQNFDNTKILDIKGGDILFMSSYLIHKTHVNKDYSGWKLSISRRYDDLNCQDWPERKYANAYQNAVDRDLYLSKYGKK